MYAARRPFRRFSLVIAGSLVTPVLGAEIWVDDNCSPPVTGACDDPYCTIQDGVDASLSGDTIWVRPGTYTLSSTLSINYSRGLRSTDGPTNPDGSARTKIVGRVEMGSSGAQLLEGFYVTNSNGNCVTSTSRGAVIRGNVITGCSDSGVKLLDSDALVIDNVISNNTALTGGGILIAGLDTGDEVRTSIKTS